ncbi:MAG: acylaminoacyl-peptidase [Chloroflexi bacterium]|nr:MAG: acylaminoacyl-peptidase [Chloroflexota bacterium]
MPSPAVYRSLRVPLLFLVAIILITACGSPDPSIDGVEDPQTGAEPGGKILFVADGNVMRWDGRIQRLTEGVHAASPTWAPAGDRFAYVQMHDGWSELVVADRDGNTLVQVTNNEPADVPFSQEFAFNAAWALDPVWSPAGEQLAFISDLGGYDEFSDPMTIWYSETWEVPPYPLNAALAIAESQEAPTFSPDGNMVAFVVRIKVSDSIRNTEIWTLDLNTAESTVLVSGPEAAYDPVWSPDGADVAFIQRSGSANDVWIAPLDGRAPYKLTNIGACVSPVWSPDGNFLAFFRLNEGEFEAWYVALTRSPDGTISASEPKKLFEADNIDAPSGMSWIAGP